VIYFTESRVGNPYYDLTGKQNSLLGKIKNIINVKHVVKLYKYYSLNVKLKFLENNMKGLNKLVLASAIAAISAGAQAELKALDDSAMGELTGQAGLTIDIETQYTIGEFAFRDGGSVLFQNISMGGSDKFGGGLMKNIRLNLDVASAGEELHYGFSEITELAGILQTDFNNVDSTIDAVASQNMASIGKAELNQKVVANDGDLVIHIDATDHLARAGGFEAVRAGLSPVVADLTTVTLAGLVPYVHAAVDFGYKIGAIKLASSDYVIGSGSGAGVDDFTTSTGQSTTLISDLSINGYLGPVDILIQNNGNGFDGVFQAGAVNTEAGNADSKILWDTYIDVTDLDVYIDIAGVKIEDLQINNKRGDVTNIDGEQSFGFAHSKREIYAVKDAVLRMDVAAVAGGNPQYYVDGIAINTQFKGDMEIGALSFGDTGTSIGELFFTDITSTTNWTISAHE
jgi:HSP20 family molecular chaperone IbpA